MTNSMLGVCLVALLVTSCATAPYPEESKVTLQEAIVGASRALTNAEQQIRSENRAAGREVLKTYNLRPSKATVSFDLSTLRGQGNSAQITVAAPTVPVGGVLGWSATKQVQTSNHVVIEFTPKK